MKDCIPWKRTQWPGPVLEGLQPARGTPQWKEEKYEKEEVAEMKCCELTTTSSPTSSSTTWDGSRRQKLELKG